jgi:hypothetical protein
MKPFGNSVTMVLPPYAKYPSSSPRLTVDPFLPPLVHTILPTCRQMVKGRHALDWPSDTHEHGADGDKGDRLACCGVRQVQHRPLVRGEDVEARFVNSLRIH